MKKIKYLVLIIIAVLISLNMHIKKGNNSSSIWMGNVEALSQSENIRIDCSFIGSLDCPISSSKVKYISR
jgi:hypothetical protein